MPVFKVQTNAVIQDKETFMKEATTMLSHVLQKPEQYIMVIPEAGSDMMFSGNDEPAVYAELKSIGLPQNKTAVISAEICAFLEEKLGVPQNRMYIEFTDAERHMFGWNGGTF